MRRSHLIADDRKAITGPCVNHGAIADGIQHDVMLGGGRKDRSGRTAARRNRGPSLCIWRGSGGGFTDLVFVSSGKFLASGLFTDFTFVGCRGATVWALRRPLGRGESSRH